MTVSKVASAAPQAGPPASKKAPVKRVPIKKAAAVASATVKKAAVKTASKLTGPPHTVETPETGSMPPASQADLVPVTPNHNPVAGFTEIVRGMSVAHKLDSKMQAILLEGVKRGYAYGYGRNMQGKGE